MKETKGDLIELAKKGMFDVITHGCNCFCTMGAGIAVPMKEAFGCDKFHMESPEFRGNVNKLGSIDYKTIHINKEITSDLINVNGFNLTVINSYTQYRYGRNHSDGDKNPVDYEAIQLCMRKINHVFKGKTIGLPMIGAGLAGGDWNKIKLIIEKELKDMNIFIVKYNKPGKW